MKMPNCKTRTEDRVLLAPYVVKFSFLAVGIYRHEMLEYVFCPGGTPYNGLYGEAPPERGTFFRLQVYKKVGISRVEVYERVRKSVI